jgi:hypothetical protein
MVVVIDKILDTVLQTFSETSMFLQQSKAYDDSKPNLKRFIVSEWTTAAYQEHDLGPRPPFGNLFGPTYLIGWSLGFLVRDK